MLGPPIDLTDSKPLVPDEYVEFISAFERVQAQTGMYFNLPREITPEIYQDVMRADRLLRGETLKVTFGRHSGTLNVGLFVDSAKSLGIDILAGERFTQWLVKEHSVSIGDKTLPVGVCTFVLRSVQIGNADAVRQAFANNPYQELEIQFVPGSTNKGLLRVGQGHSSVDDPD